VPEETELKTDFGRANSASAATVEDAASRAFDWVLQAGICALLAFGPLAFGAVENWSAYVLEIGAATLLAVSVIRQWHGFRWSFSPLLAPLLIFALLCLGQWLSGRSVYPYATKVELLRYVPYATFFFLTGTVFKRSERLQRLAVFFCLFGFAVSVFAILQNLSGTGKLYWIKEPHFGSIIYGPYVNHAHYAGLMEMLTPFPLLMALSGRLDPSRRALLAFAALVMALSILLSGSRGGIIAFTAEILFLLAILSRRKNRRGNAMFLAGFVIVLLVLFGWLATHELTSTIAALRNPGDPEVAGFRLTVLKDSLGMVKARPLLGWGAGTFAYVFPQYQSFYSSLYVNYAHNDYLQLLAETGISGFALLLWFLVLLFRKPFQEKPHWHRDHVTAIRMAALTGCVGILIHSFSDFNMHIPANALFFFVLAAIATMQMEGSSRNQEYSSGN